MNLKPDTKFLQRIKAIQESTNLELQKLSLPEEPRYLYDPVRYVLKGKGKRLRPILVHLTCDAFGVDEGDKMTTALAVELLHNFTLIHDDIMDQDDYRHGQKTVHKKWDESTAILSGDGVYIISQFLIAKVKTNPVEAINAFNKATLTVCEGQAYDKIYEENQQVTLDEYLLMVEKKTGVLLGVCAELGGILSNQTPEVRQRLKSYGINLGKAFQIQDDMLEIFSDPKTMGKSLGSDLTAGKQTALTILAREKYPEGWDILRNKLSEKTTEEAIPAFRKWLETHKIVSTVERLIATFVDAARKELNVVPKDKRYLLEHYTEMVLNRKK